MVKHERIDAYSPSLISRLQQCAFRVYQDRTAARSGRQRPSSPSVRLGNAAHRALQNLATRLPEIESEDGAEALVRSTWADETRAEYTKAQGNSVERTLGQLHRWPYYSSIQEHLAQEARTVFSELRAMPGADVRPEQRITSANGDLYGDPDLVVVSGGEAQVWDYKSGAVSAEDAAPDGRYGRQVLLYAALIAENHSGALTGQIRPLGRPRIPVPSSPELLASARSAADDLVAEYNDAVAANRIDALAQPGEHACGWCPHLHHCAAVWDGEFPNLGSTHVVEGHVLDLQPVGTQIALRVHSDRGTATGEVTVTGMDTRRIASLKDLAVGDIVRITGLTAKGGTSSSLACNPQGWLFASRPDDADSKYL